MKSTGLTRKIDDLGRIVLPSELRRVFGIHEGDELEISVEGDRVILQKRHDVCIFCSAESPALEYRGRRVCAACAADVADRGEIVVKLPDDDAVSR